MEFRARETFSLKLQAKCLKSHLMKALLSTDLTLAMRSITLLIPLLERPLNLSSKSQTFNHLIANKTKDLN